MMRKSEYIWQALPALMVLGTWWVVAETELLPRIILPKPVDVLGRLFGSWDQLLHHSAITLVESICGFGIGLALGWILSVLFLFIKSLRKGMMPYIIVMKSIPLVALAPIVVAVVGFGLGSKVFLAALISFFPILISSFAGLSQSSREARDMVASLGATRFEIFRYVELPGSLPRLMDGAKVAITFSMIGAVVGEFVGASSGLGYLVKTGDYFLEPERSWSAVCVIGILGFGLFRCVELVEAQVIAKYGELNEDSSVHRLSAMHLADEERREKASRERLTRLLSKQEKLAKGEEVVFFGLSLKMSPTVFAPHLGEGSRLLAELLTRWKYSYVLDVGTGSGALALLAAQKGARVVAVDRDPEAVKLAKENAARNNLHHQVKFLVSDVFDGLKNLDQDQFDLIVSNPPFLETDGASPVWDAVFDTELLFIRKLINGASNCLAPGGRVLMAFSNVGNLRQLTQLVDLNNLKPLVIVEERSQEGLEFYALQLERAH